MGSNLRTESFRRGKLANVSSGSFAISANGLMTQATLDGLATAKLYNVAADVNADPMRAVRAMFIGTAADNTTHDYRVYGAWKITGNTPSDATYYVGCLAYGQFTLSSAVGLDNDGAILTTERIADTITATATTTGTSPVGPGDFFNNYLNGVGIKLFSPIDNTPAILGIGELGNPAIILIDLKAASGDVNVVLSRDI